MYEWASLSIFDLFLILQHLVILCEQVSVASVTLANEYFFYYILSSKLLIKFLNLKINNQTCLLASSIYFFPFPKTFKNQTYVKYMLLQQSEQGCTLKYVKLRLSNINLLQTFLILRLNLFIFSYMERMSPRKYVLRKSYPKLKALWSLIA